MWQGIAVASNPSLLTALATSSHLSAFRLEMTTFAPARANASAIERPMPFVEPVTIATLSLRLNSSFDILIPVQLHVSKDGYPLASADPHRRHDAGSELCVALSTHIKLEYQEIQQCVQHSNKAAPNDRTDYSQKCSCL